MKRYHGGLHPALREGLGPKPIMYYTYILKDDNNKLYIGYSSNLKRRITEHLQNKVYTTKRMKNLKLLYYEC